ncbi:MAG TPA: ATP-binding protein, partial [Gaiellaceae bacterium]|nr:ATP-binding protein [Gaiellaceae bacterium]
MTTTVPGPSLEVVGRDRELAALHEFLRAGPGPALVLTGGPGIGKTTLWEAGVEAARREGLRILTARPTDAEARLGFAALIDLLDGVEADELRAVPPPQLHALEVALLRTAPAGQPAQTQASTVGLLNALRALAARDPLAVAIDDVQWLDPPSATALTYAARRLEGAEVRFLLARRPGAASALEAALEPRGVERLDVGPLSLGATRRLLLQRVGLSVPRPLMRRIHSATLGNPLFALEVGRTLVEQGFPAIGEELPVPDVVEDVLGTRLAGLPGAVRQALLAVALEPDLRRGQLVDLVGPRAVDEALDSGVLVVEGDHVRASHPLLAAAATRAAAASERRRLHRDLATLVAPSELRVRHLALAAARPDAALAATVAGAAADAAARSAVHTAVELADHALRLTPRRHGDRSARLLELCGYLELAGEERRVTDLLVPELDSLPRGEARVRALMLLSSGAVTSNAEIQRYHEQALADSGGDPRLRAPVLVELSANASVMAVEQIPQAEARAAEALPAARRAGPQLEQVALEALGWARSLRGLPVDDLCHRFRAASETVFYVAKSPERPAAQRLAWRGETREARAVLTRLLSLADERGEATSYALLRLLLCELELRVGHWDAAERLLVDWAESSDLEAWAAYDRCRALLAAGRGLPGDAKRWGEQAIERAEATGVGWDRLEATRALGIAALLARDPSAAAGRLQEVWEHTEREGVEEPGAFPVAPDLVEALAELGELDAALAVTSRLGELAERQEHPWGRVSTRRCETVVALAESFDEAAAAALGQAAGVYAGLGLGFD